MLSMEKEKSADSPEAICGGLTVNERSWRFSESVGVSGIVSAANRSAERKRARTAGAGAAFIGEDKWVED
jgi:hypothetical protein